MRHRRPVHHDIDSNAEPVGKREEDGFASAFIRYVPSFKPSLANRRRLIRFAGTEQVIESSIGFRPNLPNDVTFIVLGQFVRCC